MNIPKEAFAQIDHRPWPLPERPWALQQRWSDLLFLHWEIEAEALRHLIPAALEIDLFDGTAWIAVVPFSMQGVAPRGCPQPSFLCDFPEINVRTYVKRHDRPGVWFFSLDVPNQLPVWIAHALFHLPYFKAEMDVANGPDGTRYQSRSRNRAFKARYRGGSRFEPRADSFERWATERYCLYSASSAGRIYRAHVQHPIWPLQQADLEIQENTMLHDFPIGPSHPSVLFAKRLSVVAWMPEKLSE